MRMFGAADRRRPLVPHARTWPRVTKKVSDDSIEPIRFTQDDFHQLGLRRIAVHLNAASESIHAWQQVDFEFRERLRRHAADRCEAILTSRSFFQAADVSQILKTDHHAGGFAGFRR